MFKTGRDGIGQSVRLKRWELYIFKAEHSGGLGILPKNDFLTKLFTESKILTIFVIN